MNCRIFGGTDMKVSEIGLGCWQLGGSDWGSIDEKSARQILTTAVESGINFFDTADVYGDGRSETLIGQFLKNRSDRIFVATKLGRTGSLYPDKYSEGGLRRATEASLKRLGVEALDLTQLHCVPAKVMRQGDVFEWLRTLQDEGKIKHFGASVESMDEALLCLEQEGLVSLQIIFNLFRQRPITALFPQAQKKNVAIIVRLPLASGLLGGKLTRASTFPENDHRNYNRDGRAFSVGETFAGLPLEKGVDLTDELRALVPSGLTMAQMAQRWILDYAAVTTVITGASRPDQVASNASSSDLPPLDPALHDKLQSFHEEKVAAFIRGVY
jgi:aryl-alcohol dehydrogenase-like predicted oxidoreductase